MSAYLLTQSEAAEALGVSDKTIRDLAEKWGRTPKPIRHNGKAKGFDPDDLAVFRQALNMTEMVGAAT